MTISKAKFAQETDDALIHAVSRAIASVKQQSGYGSVEITIHDGRVTQIERREKVRFEHKTNNSKT